MRILLCAYACDPGKGSEPGLGWSWAVQLARLGHDVHVLTRESNRPAIEAAPPSMRGEVNFIFFDLHEAWRWPMVSRLWPFKPGLQLFWHAWHYPYHFFWQKGAIARVAQVHKTQPFDVVHQVTFATLRRSVFFGDLGCTFILGPAGGGERAPRRLRFAFGIKNGLYESVREWSIWLTRLNPLIQRMCRQATVIYASTEESRALVPTSEQSKVRVKLQLGLDELPQVREVNRRDSGEPFKVLYVGRFLYWKGMGLGLRAFARLVEDAPSATLTMVGSGPEEAHWRAQASELGIADRIEWIPWLDRSQLASYYANHHVLLFPSLHDSGGLVVVEAMAHGLPVVCLNLGGPGVSVTGATGVKVEANRSDQDAIVSGLAEALSAYSGREELRHRHAIGALQRARDFYWPNVVEDIYRNVP